MSEIITEISLYLILAIVLGYIFGWLITKAMTKEKVEQNGDYLNKDKLDSLNQELTQLKVDNSDLLSENNRIILENREQKLKIHNFEKEIEKIGLLLKSKNSHVEKLNSKILNQEKKHEEEMLAFLEEREEFIKKWHPSKS